MSCVPTTEDISWQPHFQALLEEEGLPPDAQARARRFLSSASLDELRSLPLDPDDLLAIGRVLAQMPSSNHAPSEALPSFSRETRSRLRALFEEDGPYADAALFLLTQDLRARAIGRALAATQ